MGREVTALAAADPDLDVVALWERPDHPSVGQRDPCTHSVILGAPGGLRPSHDREGVGQHGRGIGTAASRTAKAAERPSPCPDVVIDFSASAALAELVPLLVAARIPLVSGTTGIGETGTAALRELAAVVPVLHSANMSLGVLVLRRLVALAARMVGGDWDAEIVEVHHNRKADAPSGTALALAREIARAWPSELTQVHGRSGSAGPRKRGELGVLAVRAGDVVGEHEVIFGGTGETLRLRHVAQARSVFAAGACRAAKRLVERPPGLYTMDDLFPQAG
jgi:4-hydroxy-tetrahydrodipicolinate reductase